MPADNQEQRRATEVPVAAENPEGAKRAFDSWFRTNVPDTHRTAIDAGTIAPHIVMNLIKRAFYRLGPTERLPEDPLVPGTYETSPGVFVSEGEATAEPPVTESKRDQPTAGSPSRSAEKPGSRSEG
jgi:hypothetical protein